MAKSKTKKPAKRKARLDASQNALRVVEQAIGRNGMDSDKPITAVDLFYGGSVLLFFIVVLTRYFFR